MGVLNFISSSLGTKLVPVALILIASLLGTTVIAGKLYINSKAENALLKASKEKLEENIATLSTQLSEERQVSANLRAAEGKIEYVYIETDKEISEISTDNCLPAPDPSSLADVMCKRGLADPAACEKASAGIFTGG